MDHDQASGSVKTSQADHRRDLVCLTLRMAVQYSGAVV